MPTRYRDRSQCIWRKWPSKINIYVSQLSVSTVLLNSSGEHNNISVYVLPDNGELSWMTQVQNLSKCLGPQKMGHENFIKSPSLTFWVIFDTDTLQNITYSLEVFRHNTANGDTTWVLVIGRRSQAADVCFDNGSLRQSFHNHWARHGRHEQCTLTSELTKPFTLLGRSGRRQLAAIIQQSEWVSE